MPPNQRQHQDISRNSMPWLGEDDDDALFMTSAICPPDHPFDGSDIASALGNGIGNVAEWNYELGGLDESRIQQYHPYQPQHTNAGPMPMLSTENPNTSAPDNSYPSETQGGELFNSVNPDYPSMQHNMSTRYANKLPGSGFPNPKNSNLNLDASNRHNDSTAAARSSQEQPAHKRRRTHPPQQDPATISSSTFDTGQYSYNSHMPIPLPTLTYITSCACSLWLSQYPENPHFEPDDHAICALSTAFETPTESLRHWFKSRHKFPPSVAQDVTSIADNGCRLWTSLRPGARPNVYIICALSIAFNKPFDYIREWFDRTLQADMVSCQGTTALTAPSTINKDVTAKYQHNQKSCKNGQNTSSCEGWTAELPYSCTFRCGIRFKRKSDWQRHEETNQPQSIWQCIVGRCQSKPFVTTRRDKVKKHLEDHHTNVDDHHIDSFRIPVDSRFSTMCIFDGCEMNFVEGQSQHRWKERLDHIAKHMESGSWDASNLKELEPGSISGNDEWIMILYSMLHPLMNIKSNDLVWWSHSRETEGHILTWLRRPFCVWRVHVRWLWSDIRLRIVFIPSHPPPPMSFILGNSLVD